MSLTHLLTGSKTSYNPDADRALVPYKAGTQPTPPLQNHDATQEENSKYLCVKQPILFSVM